MSDEVRKQIVDRFAALARSPDQGQPFPFGLESAKTLGYDAPEIDEFPSSVTESFAGVGNPHSLGAYRAGQHVLDVGCGAGLDAILAARRVGPAGSVVGVDMTAEMIDKARTNAVRLGQTNVEFREGLLERLPIDNDSVDVAISNGVFNLCVDKPRVLAEVYRVLRPGGRLQMADILLHDDVTSEQVAEKGAWST